jgi:hypothetical protein
MPRAIEFKLGGTLRFIMDPEDYAGVYFTIRYRDFTITARAKDMAYTLPDGNQVQVEISYVDAQGNPATVDGEVSWSSSDPTIATVTVDNQNSQRAIVAAAAGGTIGQAQITATADADLGEGTRELITTMDVEVVAGEAVSGTISPVGSYQPIP